MGGSAVAENVRFAGLGDFSCVKPTGFLAAILVASCAFRPWLMRRVAPPPRGGGGGGADGRPRWWRWRRPPGRRTGRAPGHAVPRTGLPITRTTTRTIGRPYYGPSPITTAAILITATRTTDIRAGGSASISAILYGAYGFSVGCRLWLSRLPVRRLRGLSGIRGEPVWRRAIAVPQRNAEVYVDGYYAGVVTTSTARSSR